MNKGKAIWLVLEINHFLENLTLFVILVTSWIAVTVFAPVCLTIVGEISAQPGAFS